MKVKIKKLIPSAAIPKKAKEGDFCYDVIATSRRRIGYKKWEYGIGLAFEIERGELVLGKFEEHTIRIGVIEEINDPVVSSVLAISPRFYNNINLSIDFRPRSSIYKTGLVLSNCCGTIDELYRGEVRAIFYKVAPGKIYEVGDRIGQIKLGLTLPMEFELVDKLSETERGSDGFGSTGK